MKHTQEKILEISKKVLLDLKLLDMTGSNLKANFFEAKEIIIGPLEGQKKDVWVVSMLHPSSMIIEDQFLDNDAFLEILDETGEPMTFQNSMLSAFEIGKSDGKYHFTKEL